MSRHELTPSSLPETDFDASGSGEIWTVIHILDERGPRQTGEYLVQWDGIDPATGKLWEPTWERRQNCRADSISDWKTRKAADPSIVGTEGQWWKGRAAAERRAKAEAAELKKAKSHKRKAEDKADGGGGKRSRNGHVRQASNTASTTSQHQPSSPIAPAPARVTRQRLKGSTSAEPIPPPAGRTARAHAKAQSSVSSLDGTGVTTGRRRPREQDEPIVLEDSSKSPSPARHDGEPEENQARASAGPSVAASEQEIHPKRQNGLRPVPQPSPSVFHPYLEPAATDHSTQSTRSIPQSQADPIADFSSPAREKRSQAAPTPPEVPSMDSQDLKPETQDSTPPPRTISRYIDGEEVIVVLSESPEVETNQVGGEEEHAENEEAFAVAVDVVETREVQIQTIPESRLAEELDVGGDDADLDFLQSVDQLAEEAGGQLETSGHRCEWLGCGENFVSAADLASHVRAHGDAIFPLPTHSAESLAEAPPPAEEALNSAHSALVEECDARIAALEEENAKLHRRLASASSSKNSLQDDFAFVRHQYNEAATRAVEEVRAADDLRSQNARLKEQLTLGLKQKDLHYQAVQRQRGDDAKQLRMQLKVYQDQATMTDRIRQRAILYPKLRTENTELKEKLQAAEHRAAVLVERNESLAEQIEWYRAKQMGVLDTDKSEDDDDDYGSMSDTDEASSSVDGAAKPADIAYTTRSRHITSSGDVFSSSQIAPEPAMQGFEKAGVDDEAVEEIIGAEERWFACTARDAHHPEACRIITRTEADMRAHARLHIERAFQHPVSL